MLHYKAIITSLSLLSSASENRAEGVRRNSKLLLLLQLLPEEPEIMCPNILKNNNQPPQSTAVLLSEDRTVKGFGAALDITHEVRESSDAAQSKRTRFGKIQDLTTGLLQQYCLQLSDGIPFPSASLFTMVNVLLAQGAFECSPDLLPQHYACYGVSPKPLEQIWGQHRVQRKEESRCSSADPFHRCKNLVEYGPCILKRHALPPTECTAPEF